MPKLPPSFKQTNYFRGMVAEVYAILILTLKGYRILAWRYKTPVGEVDIVDCFVILFLAMTGIKKLCDSLWLCGEKDGCRFSTA